MDLFALNAILLLCWLTKTLFVRAEAEVFHQCIRSSPNPGIIKCVGQQTLSSLMNLEKMDNITLSNGFVMMKDEHAAQRSFAEFFTEDPMDFRGMLENAGTIVGQRSLQWDLSAIHPGLCLRVGPYSDSNSVLEFVMDPNIDRGVGSDRYVVEEESTARILTKQFILPFLLGLKFNLITILPLVFAGVILLLKKAMFLGKFAMFISGILGLGGLFGSFGHFGHFAGIRPHRPGLFQGGFGGGPGFGGIGGIGQDSLSPGYYKADEAFKSMQNYYELATTEKEPQYLDHFYNYEKKMFQDKSGKEPKTTEEPTSRANAYRSFAWKTI